MFFVAIYVEIMYNNIVMERKPHFYVSYKNVLTWLMALCMVCSAVARILDVGGKGPDLWSQIVLPVAACLLYAIIALVFGKENFYKTAIPVWMISIYYYTVFADFNFTHYRTLLMLLFAAALSSFPLPLSVFSPAGLIIGSLGSMAAGFLCSLMSREKGFFFGILCGALLFVILLIIALLVWKQKLGTYTLVKFFAMLLSGAVGGIMGVNSR